MNLSKTEKLLAARKRLKEFQLNKRQQNVPLSTTEKETICQYEDTKSQEEPNQNSNNASSNHVHNLNQDSTDNQQLVVCLEEQKQIVDQLYIQMNQCHARISELETTLSTKEVEYQTKLSMETDSLKEQLQNHARTIGILIAEKTELGASLNQSQTALREQSEEMEELLRNVQRSSFRINELEKELALIRNNNDDERQHLLKIQVEYVNLEKEYNELKKSKEDLELDVSEMTQKLNLKTTELTNCQRELEEKTTLLSLNDLKLQQITASEEMKNLENDQQNSLHQQLSSTQEALRALNEEKEETNKRYQNFIQQLNQQISQLTNDIDVRTKNINDLETREQSYIERLSNLEQKLQSEKNQVERLLPFENYQGRIDELNVELDKFRLEINEKDTTIESLKAELSKSQELYDQNVEASKLVKVLEGEQIGASRAISQNQQLKQQLQEMHSAFIELSNTKLTLTERLEAERHIGRKLNTHLSEIEDEINRLKDELENEKLQKAQLNDQIQHYQAQACHAQTLQEELQRALSTIENLKKDKERPTTTVNDETNQTTEQEIVSNIPNPMKKLEDRFKETIEKVAELTDEKQKLEHLVLQLQSETETIGEYVSLYQNQRSILQEKAREKETEYHRLIEQRNLQQEQLHKLKVLVGDLLKKTTDKVENPTTSEIMDLLAEIKGCQDTCVFEPNYHPCPWCSGKLITV